MYINELVKLEYSVTSMKPCMASLHSIICSSVMKTIKHHWQKRKSQHYHHHSHLANKSCHIIAHQKCKI